MCFDCSNASVRSTRNTVNAIARVLAEGDA
jgi:hypothetical protein